MYIHVRTYIHVGTWSVHTYMQCTYVHCTCSVRMGGSQPHFECCDSKTRMTLLHTIMVLLHTLCVVCRYSFWQRVSEGLRVSWISRKPYMMLLVSGSSHLTSLSLSLHRSLMTHASIPAEDREKIGISDSLVG